MTVPKGDIVRNVVTYLAKEIVEDADAVEVTMVEQGPDEVIAEVGSDPAVWLPLFHSRRRPS